MKLVLACLFLSISFLARAEENFDCSPINFQKGFPPVRDQESQGLCYAMATADLIAFRTHHDVSFIDLAVQTNRYTEEAANNFSDVDGGDAQKTLKAAQKYGVCSTRRFPDDKNSIDQMVKAFKIYQSHIQCPFRGDHLSQNMYDLLAVGGRLDKDSLGDAVDAACEPREKIMNAYPVRHFNTSAALAGVDEAFKKGQPSMIGTSSTAVIDDHEMIAVGRQINPKTKACEYIVRNSWGNCSTYDKIFMTKLTDKGIRCEDGYLYMERKAFSGILNDSMYLE